MKTCGSFLSRGYHWPVDINWTWGPYWSVILHIEPFEHITSLSIFLMGQRHSAILFILFDLAPQVLLQVTTSRAPPCAGSEIHCTGEPPVDPIASPAILLPSNGRVEHPGPSTSCCGSASSSPAVLSQQRPGGGLQILATLRPSVCGSTAMYNNARILGGPYVQSKHDWSERAGKHKATPERMREGEREGLRPRCGSEIESWSESRSELTGKQDSHRARERKAELTMNVRAAKEHDETVGESKMKQRQHEKIWQGRRPQRETLCPW